MDIFNLYEELPIFTNIIKYFSILNYFVIFMTAFYLIRLIAYGKFNKIITHKSIFLYSAIITTLNYYNVYTFELLSISILYICIAAFSYLWIYAKSLKWINLSMALFILTVICSYDYFNSSIHRVSYPYFFTHDIIDYVFTFKPYFAIYRPEINSFLGSVSFSIDNETIKIVNDTIEYRIYMFYYVLNVIAILFWLFIYFDILKKHNLDFNKIIKEANNNFFISKLKELNFVIHQNIEHKAKNEKN